MSEEPISSTAVAVIGMSCRFPGAENLTEYWENLRDGVESISTFSDEELEAAGIHPSIFKQPNYVKAGSVLEDIDRFDAAFFGINPREAESMDPQQRLFLECAWHALEDAGYDPETCGGSIGVYGGCAASSYLRELERHPEFVERAGHLQILIGNDKDYLTTHTSYKLNLKGPSFSVQTACSTSLLAIALAWQALLSKQCQMALAGGVCVRVPHKAGYIYEPGGIFSPDGHCRVFDARASGVVFGNGVGIVVLKSLADALADGDSIYAVIRGAAINNDGLRKASYTAPGLDGQADVILKAHAVSGVDPETITYVETHGTGTATGDPIEIAALTKAFRVGTAKRQFCAVGSVKTNIGHLDPAAGVASFIKTVLALQNKLIPPSLYFEQPNPNIDFASSPFWVNTGLSAWDSGTGPRRAGVSAFGIGGTNVHVVLEEAPQQRLAPAARTHNLITLSARSLSALDAATSNLSRHLQEYPNLSTADVAFTSQIGRRAFPYRRVILATNSNDAIDLMLTLDRERVITGANGTADRAAVFMFSGQGSQYHKMSAGLYRSEAGFRDQVDRCAQLLERHIERDIRELIFPARDSAAESLSLTQTRFAQPALFVIEYALAQLWQEWGLKPWAMIGHSIGEYVAACLSGVLSLEDALMLVAARGRLMQALPEGAMIAVPLGESEMAQWLGGDVSIAAVNEEMSSVISGPLHSIGLLEKALEAKGIRATRLHTSHAFHSAMMDPILDAFGEVVRRANLNAPATPYISSVTGTWVSPAETTNPGYWQRQIRDPVRFAVGLRSLMSNPGAVFIEVGPGNTLSTFALRHPCRTNHHVVVPSLPHAYARGDDTECILKSVARLWVSGLSVNWRGFQSCERRRRVHIPPYPFERQRYWVDPPGTAGDGLAKNPDVSSWFYLPSWEYTLTADGNDPFANSRNVCCVIFADRCGWGDRVGQTLERWGYRVITVKTARRFAQIGPNQFLVNPRKPEHYLALFQRLKETRRWPQKILHFWSVTRPSSASGPDMELFDTAQNLGFYSLIYLTKAVLGAKKMDLLEIVAVSSGIHSVSGDEQLSPSKATILGACKSIPQEYPHISCRAIDIVIPEKGPAVDGSLVDQLSADLVSGSLHPIVAYRGGQRWAQVFERNYLEPPEDIVPLLRNSGVYLITGGLGNIGLAIAEELASSVQADLVLVGRSAFPRPAQWQKWLRTHDRDDPTSRRIRHLQDIESFGSRVMVFSADVADESQMRRVVKRIYAGFGDLHGVIHAAGDLSPSAFFGVDQVTPEFCERQFRSKVRGLLTMAKILEKRDLDFWLLVSSISSVLAGLGYIAYSAANNFLDAFAVRQALRSDTPWVSVDWDTWNFEARVGKPSERNRGELSMTPAEGIDALSRILSWNTASQVVVSTGNLGARMEQWIYQSSGGKGDERASRLHARPELIQYVAPRNQMERALTAIWQDTLGLVTVGVMDNFFTDLSGTSLMATQLVARIRSEFETELPLRTFFEAPTVAQLALALEIAASAPAIPLQERRAHGGPAAGS